MKVEIEKVLYKKNNKKTKPVCIRRDRKRKERAGGEE